MNTKRRADSVPSTAIPFNHGESLSGDYTYIAEDGTPMEVVSVEVDPRDGRGRVMAYPVTEDWYERQANWYDERGYEDRKNSVEGDLLMVPKHQLTDDVASVTARIEGVAYALARNPHTPLKEVAKQLSALAIEILTN